MPTWTNGSKSSSSYSNQTKSSSSWTNLGESLISSFLLLESGDYMLLEIGDKILLEQSVPSIPTWNNQTKL